MRFRQLKSPIGSVEDIFLGLVVCQGPGGMNLTSDVMPWQHHTVALQAGDGGRFTEEECANSVSNTADFQVIDLHTKRLVSNREVYTVHKAEAGKRSVFGQKMPSREEAAGMGLRGLLWLARDRKTRLGQAKDWRSPHLGQISDRWFQSAAFLMPQLTHIVKFGTTLLGLEATLQQGTHHIEQVVLMTEVDRPCWHSICPSARLEPEEVRLGFTPQLDSMAMREVLHVECVFTAT